MGESLKSRRVGNDRAQETSYNNGVESIKIMKLNCDDLDVLKREGKLVLVKDDGDWEYVRLGVVEVNGEVGVFDYEELEFGDVSVDVVKSGLSVDDVLELGVESGYLVNDGGELRVSWENEDEGKVKFEKLIGV